MKESRSGLLGVEVLALDDGTAELREEALQRLLGTLDRQAGCNIDEQSLLLRPRMDGNMRLPEDGDPRHAVGFKALHGCLEDGQRRDVSAPFEQVFQSFRVIELFEGRIPDDSCQHVELKGHREPG